eukprot:936183-Amphidinium_carterae.1
MECNQKESHSERLRRTCLIYRLECLEIYESAAKQRIASYVPPCACTLTKVYSVALFISSMLTCDAMAYLEVLEERKKGREVKLQKRAEERKERSLS